MGSLDCFWTIFSLKKRKEGQSNKVKSKESNCNHEHSNNLANGHSSSSDPCVPQTVVAAIRIQTAFRAFVARKAFKHLKGAVKFQVLIEDHAAKNQALNTLNYIHSWSKIQAEIRARRLCMVTEGRLKQKKLENQLKVDAMLHELEVEWCGGSETMEEILMRIQQREAATVKRERALAYAFSHQWRANSSQYMGQTYYEVGGKESWGWSWTERWIAARPWEIRVQSMPAKPMKVLTKMPIRAGKVTDNMATKTTVKMANLTSAMSEGKKMPDPNAEQERAKDVTPLQCLSEF